MPQPKLMTWIGWILTVLLAAMLSFSAFMKITQPPEVVEMFGTKMGFSQDLFVPIAIVEIACVVIFLIPQTAVLGAVLLTAYLGGAVVTHLRINDNFAGPIIVGVAVWLAIFLRDPRVRSLLPLRWPMTGKGG